MPKPIVFSDFKEFRPNLTPRQMFKMGSFGGTYWRPIDSGVVGKRLKNRHQKLPKTWWKGLDEELMLTSSHYDKNINKYKVKVGSSLKEWENSGWIKKQDPYGWVEWYCHFYNGRRTSDDRRQVDRWLKLAGPNGRFKKRIVNMIVDSGASYNDHKISPAIRQTLQHWAYAITPSDLR